MAADGGRGVVQTAVEVLLLQIPVAGALAGLEVALVAGDVKCGQQGVAPPPVLAAMDATL